MQTPATELSPVKRALLEIRELRARIAELESAPREPIAIVGIGIRAPGGVRDVASFTELLWSGVDAITPIPPDRWPLDAWYDESQDTPGKMTTRFGGFVGDVQRFDAEFFGIAPLEAASMDPQQRLVLQLAWEALENAGHSPAALAGTRAGIYLGIANSDYGRALFAHPDAIDPYFSTGTAFSIASGRLAYFLGVHGPAVSIDTACSSSLVSVHLACQGLRLEECDLALAGGVSLILTPELNVNFSKAGMMARDGRCKTFDAAGDGYVRGEGGGMLVLRRLRDAQADGDRILAIIRGSAMNQDGRSNGLTAPNGPAQEAVIRAALQAANIAPAEVGYVEAHGTGTPLGDPIEVNALGAVLAEGRAPEEPLLLGSVKTNIGHLEAAAGVAGLVKAIIALQRREIPPHLHLKTLNPYIDWASLPIRVPTETTPWKPIQGKRVAGVSSFGFSGTNAHVILEEAPPEPAKAVGGLQRPAHVLALSARDPQTLQEIAARYAAVLDGASAAQFDVADVCFTAAAGRSHFANRLTVSGNTPEAMSEALAAYRAGGSHARLATGTRGARQPRVAFLFPGQGPQYVGMGRALYDSSPVFRAALDECLAVLDPLLPQPLGPVIFGQPGVSGSLDETAYAQPAMFAIEMALAALWRSWGIEPVAVMGHSFGEYAAACVAGAVSMADAARMVVARGRLVQGLPRNGAMTVIEASEESVAAALENYRGRVAIAAINGPANTVISGERVAVDEIAARFAAAGSRTKALRVSHAFHSPLVDPVLDEFEREIGATQYAEPRLALVSNLSGRLADLALIGRPAYWRDHMRQPVRFADSIQALAAQGVTHCIEMSPHPVLLGMGAECLTGAELEWLPSLHRERDDWTDLLAGLQRLYVSGADVDWNSFERGYQRKRLELPSYPFRERRHWMDIVGKLPANASISAAARWARVSDAASRQAEQGPLDLNVSSYPAKWDCLERVTVAHAIATLRDAGLFLRVDEDRTLDEVLATAGIAVTYKHLVQRWLERLAARGLLQMRGDTYRSPKPLPEPGIAALWAEADHLFADNRALLDYVKHCGSLVSPVLRGQESPLETLFPGGSPELAQNLYERSAMMRYVNTLAAAAFGALSASTPPGSVLRVLEVGAGTGGTSASLLPALLPDRTRYVFTDMSDLFLDRARERFTAYPFVDYRLFDMEREPAAQGFAAGSFDVVVSANAIHASTDLRLTLRRLRELLAPGGLLVLVESTQHFAWFDMTTGLIEGWQQFADDLRTDNPLLAPEKWLTAFHDAGFEAAVALPGTGSAAAELGQHMLMARVPGELAGGTVGRVATDDHANVASASAPSSAANTVEPAAAFRQRLTDALPDDRLEVVRDFVREHVVRVLKLDATEPPGRHERLMDLGLDSLMAVQLRNQLAKGAALERPLPATVMFDYPTIEELARHLLERLAPPAELASAPMAAPVTAAAPELGAAAIAAMSDEQIEALLLERLGQP
jgi:acyl transferase domain-containing protein/SAM-dependent methyltransferase